MRLGADDPIDFCGGRRLNFSARLILLVAPLLAMLRPPERECNMAVVGRSSPRRKCESH